MVRMRSLMRMVLERADHPSILRYHQGLFDLVDDSIHSLLLSRAGSVEFLRSLECAKFDLKMVRGFALFWQFPVLSIQLTCRTWLAASEPSLRIRLCEIASYLSAMPVFTELN
jgi:hypothetical protein